jgi:ATP-binding cassette subfamily B protein
VQGITGRLLTVFDPGLARLTTTISGLEHHERPDYLKQLDLLQRNLYTLSNAPTQNLLTLLLLVRLATVVVLLATVDPVLALLPVLVAFPRQPARRAGYPPGPVTGQRARPSRAASGRRWHSAGP